MLIKDLPNNCKPREKALALGINNLGDDELLAIILRTGYKNTSVKELAQLVLKETNDLSNFNDISINKLAKIKGIGITKAITILASIELGKRVVNVFEMNNLKLNNSAKVFNYVKNIFNNNKQEEFIVILLDNKKKLIDSKIIFKGDLNSVNIHPREIFKYAIVNSAASLIVAHNHPSGDVFPSKNDIEITKEIIEIGNLLKIPVIDHIIIGNNNYYSFFESEALNEKN